MTAPTSRASAPHYRWGIDCDGWHLVQADALSVIEERIPAGRSDGRHAHARARQFFYVLRGTLTLECVGGPHTLMAGMGLEVAPGLAHQARNASDGPVDFLVVSQPPSHGDREERI